MFISTFVVLVDISKYTQLTEEDPNKASQASRILEDITQKVLEIRDGEYIKSKGDSVLLKIETFDNAYDITKMIHSRWCYAKKIIGIDNDLHSCITYGQVTYDGRPKVDILGGPVNQTDRISKQTPTNSIYISEDVKTQIAGDSNYISEDKGEFDLTDFGQKHLYSVMRKNDDLISIVNKIINKIKEIRKTILEEVKFTTARSDLPRLGDQHPMTDDEVADKFEKALSGIDVYFVSEHKTAVELDELKKYKYVCILDPIDGSVNSMHGLPFGSNFAIGKVRDNVFSIKDIDAVIVVDYQSGIYHKWVMGDAAELVRILDDGSQIQLDITYKDPSLFEVPDENSYIRDENGKKRQEKLLHVFRQMFPVIQRRSLDSTGLRMLAVVDRNLRAYGDNREVTYIWDTIPSIRYMMEFNDIKLLKGDGTEYKGSDWIIRSQDKKTVKNNIGTSSIILFEQDYSDFMKIAEQEIFKQE